MQIRREFSTFLVHPYADIEWERRESRMNGVTISPVIVPSFWSQTASDILAQKYFRKSGVPWGKVYAWRDFAEFTDDNDPGHTLPNDGAEHDARQVFHRLAWTWQQWGIAEGLLKGEEEPEIFYKEIVYMLAHQIAAPNSPQWFNTGLYAVYGIEGPPQGHYYADSNGLIQQASSAYERPQPHACFILSVDDNLVEEGGIMDLFTREARLFKFGSGTGTNVSKIRGKGEPLSGGGRSSGLLSFLKAGDRAAAAIQSGGVTRRAAVLRTLDIDHPDILEFIQWKPNEEYKVASLVVGSTAIAQTVQEMHKAIQLDGLNPDSNPALYNILVKAQEQNIPPTFLHQFMRQQSEWELPIYDSSWGGEAYNTVSGQAANVSIRVTNEFMKAVGDDTEWLLRDRTNPNNTHTVSARQLWAAIIEAAWACADPGLQFHDTINEWHTCRNSGDIRASNPCSEFMFIDDSACNLASLNLVKFLRKDGILDMPLIHQAVRLWTMVLEISVYMAQYPSKTIAKNSYEFRPLGLGYANLGGLLMRMGVPYDSADGRFIAASMTALMTGWAYETSAEMAEIIGPFPAWQMNSTVMMRVIHNHARVALSMEPRFFEELTITPPPYPEDGVSKKYRYLYDDVRSLWEKIDSSIKEPIGLRNAQVSALAPAGTIGLLMDCDTTGIEPDYALVKYKTLAGGGNLILINQGVPAALERLGYTQDERAAIMRYVLGHRTLTGCPYVYPEALAKKGLSLDEIHAMELNVKSAMEIETVLKDHGLDPVRDLNLTPGALLMINKYIFGHLTMEGAPGIKSWDIPVFDTAVPSGREFQRMIPWKAHILMMAAVQSFVTGAISKTVNMPSTATASDVGEAYALAWKLGLKSITVYRDGSKLSQPLSSQVSPFVSSVVEKSQASTEEVTPTQVVQRKALPSFRRGFTQKVKIAGQSLFLRTGEYEDGSLGEIFLTMRKKDATFRSLLDSFAVAVSLGLQYGVPLEEYIDAFASSQFPPNGKVEGHESIHMTTSVLDYVFRDLALRYSQPKSLDTPVQATPQFVEVPKGEAHTLLGYENLPCPNCGVKRLVRNGSCMKCENCGETTGCS